MLFHPRCRLPCRPLQPSDSHTKWTEERGPATTGSASYGYDGDGLRTKKTVGAQSAFSWDVAGGSPQLLSDGQASYIPGPDGLPLEQVSSTGQVSYYHHDQRGSTRALSDQSGAVAASWDFDPYGNQTAKTGTGQTPFGYAGQYTDAESGLQYRGSRYYDPQTAQYASRGPLDTHTGNPYSADAPTDAPATDAPAPGGDGPQPKPPPRIVHPALTDVQIEAEIALLNKDFGDSTDYCSLICGAFDAIVGDPLHDPLDAIGLLPAGKLLKAGGLISKLLAGGAKAAKGGLGDLTRAEVKQIQGAVDRAGRPLEVAGSAAKGQRRGIGTKLPIGKGPGTRSDIDYLIGPSSRGYYKGLEGDLPGMDVFGPITGTHNPFIGPAIRFEPGASPRFLPGAN